MADDNDVVFDEQLDEDSESESAYADSTQPDEDPSGDEQEGRGYSERYILINKQTFAEAEKFWSRHNPYAPKAMRLLEKFCEEFVASGYNQVRAARNMGYGSSADTVAKRFMSHPEFEKVLDAVHNRYLSRMRMRADRVLVELAKIAFASVGDFFKRNPGGTCSIKQMNELTREELAAVSEIVYKEYTDGRVELKIKMHDKLTALDRLGKHFGLFGDKGATAAVFEEVFGMDEDAAVTRILEISDKLRQRLEKKNAKQKGRDN